MVVYLYDGSFEGLLTAIHEAYYRRDKPERIVPRERYCDNLFSLPMEILTDPEKSDKVYRAIKNKISPTALKHVFCAFLSEVEGAGTAIYRYLRLGFTVGSELDRHLADERVHELHRLSRKVRLEKQRFLGLIRFRRLNHDIYYAPIEPDHNILPLVAPHFAKRFSTQNWLIHDLTRSMAAVHNENEWLLTPLAQPKELHLPEEELSCQKLWKQFFTSIAIAERKNPRLQRQHLPIRYRRLLIEMDV